MSLFLAQLYFYNLPFCPLATQFNISVSERLSFNIVLSTGTKRVFSSTLFKVRNCKIKKIHYDNGQVHLIDL